MASGNDNERSIPPLMCDGCGKEIPLLDNRWTRTGFDNFHYPDCVPAPDDPMENRGRLIRAPTIAGGGATR
jgi:hypothetical protein